jgi:dihydroorotase
VLANLNRAFTVTPENILSKCGWSPFNQQTFRSSVETTIVSGNVIYEKGQFIKEIPGKRLLFERK